jgi:acetyl-CoA acetyltransferase
MPEAVIVDAVRTPIGRAETGSLKDVRADDLAAVPLKALLERNRGVDFAETVDIMWGAAVQVRPNRIPGFLCEVDGVDRHFWHVRGAGPSPLPRCWCTAGRARSMSFCRSSVR